MHPIYCKARIYQMEKIPGYSKILSDELIKRKQLNPRYSLRAFARLLKISYPTVSLAIRGKIGISKKKAQLIADQLSFTAEDTAYFVDLVVSESARSKIARIEAQQRLNQYRSSFNAISLDAEAFQLVSSWYSFPIMELVRIFGTKANHSFLAKRLGILLANVRIG